MSADEIEQVRQFCRAILRAFPGATITVKNRPQPPETGREAA